MRKGVRRVGGGQRVARSKERLDAETEILVAGGNKIELVRGRVTHGGGEKIVCQGELVGQVPQQVNARRCVVIVTHGVVAAVEGKLVHQAVIRVLEQTRAQMRHVGYSYVRLEERGYTLA